jgi:large subunit ribosomal protein L22
MPGPKTNEREGTRAVHRHARISAYKVREVLNLIRNKAVTEAADILRFTERDAGIVVGKVLASAVANAAHNDQLDPEELYVSACFADEGTTIKRWRPRARGRATRIRKRTCHITVIVSRMNDEDLTRLYARREAEQAARRARRVAGARKADAGGGGRAGREGGSREGGNREGASREGGARGLRTRVRPSRRRAEGHEHDEGLEAAVAAATANLPELGEAQHGAEAAEPEETTTATTAGTAADETQETEETEESDEGE